MRYAETAIAPFGIALALLAWIVPQDRIGFELQFSLLGFGLAVMCLSLWLLVRGAWVGHGKQKALVDLSKALSLAITELVNKPWATPGGIEQFAKELRGEYDEWCGGVHYILANQNHFSYSTSRTLTVSGSSRQW